MPNTFTGLIPQIYEGLNVVSREMTGFIPAVARNASAERAAVGQPIRVPIAPEEAVVDVAPGVTAPDAGDTTTEYVDMTISKSRAVQVRITGEETQGLQNAGNYDDVMRQRFEQGFRALSNEVEADLASTYVSASRAVGVAGTSPFGTKDNLTDIAGVMQVLEDNGTPKSELQLVLGGGAFYNLRGVQTGLLQRVNEAGTAAALRSGVFGEIHGFTLRNSAQVKAHTKGTGASYLSDETGGYDKGDTGIHVDTGTGSILAGDVVTFADDANQYVVATGTAGDGDQDIAIAKPGLRQALANNKALTIGGSYAANMAFRRGAIQLVARPPALPEGGDSADDRMMVTDPITGLTFELAYYRQYRQVYIEISLAWGWKAIKPEHIALLLG